MSKINYNENLIGKRFNKLVVIEKLEEYTTNNGHRGYRKWKCVCDCGKAVTPSSFNLLRGISGSCGISGCGAKHAKDESLIGKKFGKLSVINLLEDRKYHQKHWLCLCECGKTAKVITTSLNSGSTTHCGCGKLKKDKNTCTPPKERAVIPHEKRITTSLKDIYRTYKHNAKIRGIAFELPFENFAQMHKKRCFYCGDAPRNHKKGRRGMLSITYSGIDRVNNAEGYFIGNCVPCCSMCNAAKLDKPIQEFIDWALRLGLNIRNKNE
jgi:hypothetical protein